MVVASLLNYWTEVEMLGHHNITERMSCHSESWFPSQNGETWIRYFGPQSRS